MVCIIAVLLACYVCHILFCNRTLFCVCGVCVCSCGQHPKKLITDSLCLVYVVFHAPGIASEFYTVRLRKLESRTATMKAE